jgi:hypothetical protein
MTIINYLFTSRMMMWLVMRLLFLHYTHTDELWETDSGIFDFLDSPPPNQDGVGGARKEGSRSETSADEHVDLVKIS